MRVSNHKVNAYPVRPESGVQDRHAGSRSTPVGSDPSLYRIQQDSVELSVQTRLGHQAFEVVQAAPEVRGERIAAAHDALVQGALVLDGQQLAAKVLVEVFGIV